MALAHAGLIPLEHQTAVQQTFEQLAPVLNSSPDALLAVVDKSLPTMLGLGGMLLYCGQLQLFGLCMCCLLLQGPSVYTDELMFQIASSNLAGLQFVSLAKSNRVS